jgi:four helix bundle protein
MDPQALRDRTQRFAIEVGRFCDTLPRDRRVQEIANQLHDAAFSVASNYRAVCRAQTPKLFFAKLCIVLEEIDEVEGWLQALIDSGKSNDDRTHQLHNEATELVRIFAASKRTWLRNHQQR